MKVVEIFKSIEGEGKRAGELTTFIRLFGCNLNCSYCDTRYGCVGDEYTIMSVDEIVGYCKQGGYKNVTVTGGEPLVHPGIELLLKTLVVEGFKVNVETNGTKMPIDFSTEERIYCSSGSIFYTMDYKCPSSGMEGHMNRNALKALTKNDVLKFVVGSQEDLDKALEVIEDLDTPAQVYFSPVFGEIDSKRIVEYMQSHCLLKCRIQLQMHKFIWAPDKRGV